MKIFSAAINMHDHNTYDGTFHNQAERYTRRKHNLVPNDPSNSEPGRDFYTEHILPRLNQRSDAEVIAFTCSNLGEKMVSALIDKVIPNTEYKNFTPKSLWEYLNWDNIYYIDHHQSHAVYAYLTSGYQESDILAIDGRGWKFNCVFFDKNGDLTDLSEEVNLGTTWNQISKALGFGYLGAGKLMGLSAYGKYYPELHLMIDRYRMGIGGYEFIKQYRKEDIAHTLQFATMEIIRDIVIPLKSSDNICIAGGVSYNGYMNEEFTRHYTRVHVPPAAGDEGQSLGTYMHADYMLNNNIHVPHTYAGKIHTVDESLFDGALDIKKVAQSIADGKIVGWYQGKSESGNRALGNRSILADPRNPDIKNIINTTIKKREDFRPFAPSVLEEHYQEYFDTNQPSPYMSRIVTVKSDKIPGVTHVDNTARIQTVTREFNEKFYDLINEFYKITGIPMLLNTSFNCQEPIVETPDEAYSTFIKTDLDILVVDNFMVSKSK